MTQGLEIFDAAGNPKVSITDRFTRVLGMFTIPLKVHWINEAYPTYLPGLNHSGQISDARLSHGQPFVVPVSFGAGKFLSNGAGRSAYVNGSNSMFTPPEFFFEGAVIRWDYDTMNTRPIGDPSEWVVGGFNVYYGVF